MLLIDALELLTQGLYLVMCAVILVQLIRRPAMASFEIALFFGVVAAVIALARIAAALGASQTPAVIALTFALVMALPYLLLRLAAAFGELPPFAL
ncbi:MAG TPA: hypothetical protein VGQ62_21775, partial [Chloroflexota bacterium]|nr:hypothetical protein [Chloroflexota bacterium]